jgi:hypothetical protein
VDPDPDRYPKGDFNINKVTKKGGNLIP